MDDTLAFVVSLAGAISAVVALWRSLDWVGRVERIVDVRNKIGRSTKTEDDDAEPSKRQGAQSDPAYVALTQEIQHIIESHARSSGNARKGLSLGDMPNWRNSGSIRTYLMAGVALLAVGLGLVWLGVGISTLINCFVEQAGENGALCAAFYYLGVFVMAFGFVYIAMGLMGFLAWVANDIFGRR